MLGYLERTWRPSWALRGPVGAFLGNLGRSDRSRPPPSRSRGGGRGRGKPLPEGEEGGWKRKLLKPPTPRGLVGFPLWGFTNRFPLCDGVQIDSFCGGGGEGLSLGERSQQNKKKNGPPESNGPFFFSWPWGKRKNGTSGFRGPVFCFFFPSIFFPPGIFPPGPGGREERGG